MFWDVDGRVATRPVNHPTTGHKTTMAVLAGWLILGILFVVYTAQSQRTEIEATLQRESAILHRMISQRADQHDAQLTSLSALAQAGDPPHADLFLQVARAVRRFYPRVHAVDLVSLSGEAAPITTRHNGPGGSAFCFLFLTKGRSNATTSRYV